MAVHFVFVFVLCRHHVVVDESKKYMMHFFFFWRLAYCIRVLSKKKLTGQFFNPAVQPGAGGPSSSHQSGGQSGSQSGGQSGQVDESPKN